GGTPHGIFPGLDPPRSRPQSDGAGDWRRAPCDTERPIGVVRPGVARGLPGGRRMLEIGTSGLVPIDVWRLLFRGETLNLLYEDADNYQGQGQPQFMDVQGARRRRHR